MTILGPSVHKSNFSSERRSTIQNYLRGEISESHRTISASALLLLTVGLFICGDSGTFSQAELDSALKDPSVIAAANAAIARAGI